MRLAAILLTLLVCAPVRAQLPPPDVRETLDPKKNQKIERIRVEDAGARVDELRVGGETQQITVTTKSRLPAYEVRPKDGKSLWTLHGF